MALYRFQRSNRSVCNLQNDAQRQQVTRAQLARAEAAARDSSKVLYAGETDLDLRFAGVWAVVQRLPAVMPKLYVSCTLCPHSSRACRTCAVIGAIVHLFGAHSTTWTQFSAVVFSQDADHLRHLFHDFSETCQRHALQEPAEWTE